MENGISRGGAKIGTAFASYGASKRKTLCGRRGEETVEGWSTADTLRPGPPPRATARRFASNAGFFFNAKGAERGTQGAERKVHGAGGKVRGKGRIANAEGRRRKAQSVFRGAKGVRGGGAKRRKCAALRTEKPGNGGSCVDFERKVITSPLEKLLFF